MIAEDRFAEGTSTVCEQIAESMHSKIQEIYNRKLRDEAAPSLKFTID
jgi:hypothetical protein